MASNESLSNSKLHCRVPCLNCVSSSSLCKSNQALQMCSVWCSMMLACFSMCSIHPFENKPLYFVSHFEELRAKRRCK